MPQPLIRSRTPSPQRRQLLRHVALTAATLSGVSGLSRAQSVAPGFASRPFPVEYYYKVKWGQAAEFIRLFRKNHYPILAAQLKLGRILHIKAEQPFYHSTEEGRWDYRVTVVWKDALVAHDDFDGRALQRQLFADVDAFRAEEQRRFEMLLAHWDVVVETVALEQP